MSAIQDLKQNLATTRKGVGGLSESGLALVVLVIVLAIGALVLAEFNDNTTNANATAILNDGLAGLDTMSGFIVVIAIVLVGAVVLGITRTTLGSSGGGV